MKSKKKALMIVLNSLPTDARVQRAAQAIEDTYDLFLLGVDQGWGGSKATEIIIHQNDKKGFSKYFHFIAECKKVIADGGFSLLYAHDYYSAEIAVWVKRKFPKIKVVYDSHELIIPEKGRKQSLRDRFFYLKERKAVALADLVICASSDRSRIMQEHYGLLVPPISIDNISQLQIIEDENSLAILEKIYSTLDKAKPILVYAGALLNGRRIDRLIDIISKKNEWQLLIIGDGVDRNRLEKMAESEIQGRFYFTGVVPYKYLGILLQKCDIGLISYPNDSLNNRYCAPNKIYEYASIHLPMIAPYNPTLEKMFASEKIGEINDDIEEAFNKVIGCIDQYKKGCGQFIEHNSWETKKNELLNEISNLF